MTHLKSLAGLALGAMVAVSGLTYSGSVRASDLIINADTSAPAPKQAFQDAVDAFKKENPSINVQFNVYDHESYKQSIRNWLTSAAPDVVFWYVGNRMAQFVKPGLLEDVSSIYSDDMKKQLGPVATGLVTLDGKQYGVPYTYYQWGIYYRKDIWAKAGITSAPKTWDDLMTACTKLKAAGVEPIAIGAKDLWPTAGWFDYIDLRLNGFDFHMKLMGGQISYKDPKVLAVFAKWSELLDKGCFVKNNASTTWQESQALLYQGKAAMMLIGNFITPNFPPEAAPNMAFTPFPVIDPAVASTEEAPMDSIHIPANAKNKDNAKKFLAFLMKADVQEKINKTLLQIPVNQNAAVADDIYLKQGKALLGSAAHITQFFDRDASEDFATIGMKDFTEFMANTGRVDKVTDDMEKARKRIYGIN